MSLRDRFGALLARLSLTAALSAGLVVGGFSPSAEAGEYRQLTLNDGRVIIAEILETRPEGLAIRTPQGDTLVIFEILTDMLPIDEAALAASPDWLVVIDAPPEQKMLLQRAFDNVNRVSVVGTVEAGNRISSDAVNAYISCNGDFDCVMTKSAEFNTPWAWVVHAKVEGNKVTLDGGVNIGEVRTQGVADDYRVGDQLYVAVMKSLDLIPEKKTPKAFADLGTVEAPPVKNTGEFTKEKVAGLSFIPLPGMPSLAQKDMAGFGVAMGSVVPVTALWVLAAGKNSQSTGEFVAVSVGGFYAATVAANQITGLWSLGKAGKSAKATTMVLPAMQGRGAVVQVSIPLR